jgi:hypothetical protein
MYPIQPDPHVVDALLCVLFALAVAMLLALFNLDDGAKKRWPPH